MIKGLISVIVPIYNVEEVLPRCIESICNQTYTNLEIILVNDGSLDGCGEICDNYANKDSRIKVIHKKNGGLSDARNTGMLASQGEYIAFVDSDDYIIQNTYEILIKAAIKENLDVVAANAVLIQEGKSDLPLMKEKKLSKETLTGIEYMCESIQQNSFHVCAWLNLYKRDLLFENNLYFEKGLLHEDEEWTPRVFLEAKKIRYVDFKGYMYVIREGSITNVRDKSRNGLHILKTCYKLESIYREKVSEKQRKILYEYLLNIFLGGIYIGRLDRPEYKKNIRKSFVIGKANSLKTFFKAILLIINIKLYCKVNDFSKR
ncbi:glycosyltransferase [Bacillus cereus]|uniref:glycosyltransferase n=1 Tax=Bacillus cereus TaxID=1396 RepID=UPI0030ECA724